MKENTTCVKWSHLPFHVNEKGNLEEQMFSSHVHFANI